VPVHCEPQGRAVAAKRRTCVAAQRPARGTGQRAPAPAADDRAAIASSNSATDPLQGADLCISRPSRKRSYQVVVTPLAPATQRWGQRRPAAAVVIFDPDDEITASIERCRDIFGFTRAEAQVALGIMQGQFTGADCGVAGQCHRHLAQPAEARVHENRREPPERARTGHAELAAAAGRRPGQSTAEATLAGRRQPPRTVPARRSWDDTGWSRVTSTADSLPDGDRDQLDGEHAARFRQTACPTEL